VSMSLILPRILILSLVLVSLEAMSDLNIGDLLHNDDQSHLKEFGHGLSSHGGEASDEELDGEHCQHCCHGHCAATPTLTQLLTNRHSANGVSGYDSGHASQVLTPPTPPPNV